MLDQLNESPVAAAPPTAPRVTAAARRAPTKTDTSKKVRAASTCLRKGLVDPQP